MDSSITHSLFGAIVGAGITLVVELVRKWYLERRECRILQKALKEECRLQKESLKALRKQYSQTGGVHPLRCATDLFEHALHRHVEALGDVALIPVLSRYVHHIRALNLALDKYYIQLLDACGDSYKLSNVENSRIALVKNIDLCKVVCDEVCKVLG